MATLDTQGERIGIMVLSIQQLAAQRGKCYFSNKTPDVMSRYKHTTKHDTRCNNAVSRSGQPEVGMNASDTASAVPFLSKTLNSE